MTASVTIIIPARLASTRFPEKVLACLTGRPLVQHVVEACLGSDAAQRGAPVVVAADDQRIADALRPFGTRVVMTSPSHPNGTSRLAEAAAVLGLGEDSTVINAQGDEPEMAGVVLDAAAGALAGVSGAVVGTAAAVIRDAAEMADPNVVKVVTAGGGQAGAGGARRALYFSRSPLPYDRDGRGLAAVAPLRHIGVYAYNVGFLRRYVAMAPTPLEQAEQLEQLRVLEHGYAIGVHVVASAQQGIDTPEQYERFVARYRAGNP